MDRTPIDPFFDPLDRLAYESIYESLRDVGSESQRLEFKRNLDLDELARQAVAMANGNGGIVVVGFEDPVEGKELVPFSFSDPVNEPARRRLLSRLQNKVHPSLPIDCGGYTSADGRFRLLLLRVERSDAAPHELINDRGRFYVRRGTAVEGMTLRELESLIIGRNREAPRRHSEPNDYGLEILRTGGSRGMVSFDRSVPERFVGATLHPDDHARNEPLSRTRQREIEGIVNQLDGLNAAVPQTYMYGILFQNEVIVPENAVKVDEAGLSRYKRVAYVGADGSAEIRFQVNNNAYEAPLIRVICAIYVLGSQLFLALGIGPRGNGSIVLHRGHPSDAEPHQPSSGDYPYYVNFAADTVEQTALRPLMYALRGAGILTDPGEMDEKVSEYWRNAYSGIIKDDLRLRWQ